MVDTLFARGKFVDKYFTTRSSEIVIIVIIVIVTSTSTSSSSSSSSSKYYCSKTVLVRQSIKLFSIIINHANMFEHSGIECFQDNCAFELTV